MVSGFHENQSSDSGLGLDMIGASFSNAN